MSDEDDKVKRLPVRFKKPPDGSGPLLQVVQFDTKTCNHRWRFEGNPMGGGSRMIEISYLIRDGETEVECSACATKLDPMWVLRMLATEESKWREAEERYNDRMSTLKERTRTKCNHCGKLTKISSR